MCFIIIATGSERGHTFESDVCYPTCKKIAEESEGLRGCDESFCLIQWFHYECVGLTRDTVPKRLWKCPDCAFNLSEVKEKRPVNFKDEKKLKSKQHMLELQIKEKTRQLEDLH